MRQTHQPVRIRDMGSVLDIRNTNPGGAAPFGPKEYDDFLQHVSEDQATKCHRRELSELVDEKRTEIAGILHLKQFRRNDEAESATRTDGQRTGDDEWYPGIR